MLYMLVNRTRTDLSRDQYERLREMAKIFYADVPEGLTLRGDWAANDGSRTFALLESDDPSQVRAMADRFEGMVDIEIVPVTAITGWRD